jgi:ribosomal protein S18 acetylase RimI-like enzyme
MSEFREITYPTDPLTEVAAQLIFTEVWGAEYPVEEGAVALGNMSQHLQNYCLEEEGKLVGVGSLDLRQVDQGVAELWNLAVPPESRGNGCGRKLMDNLEARALEAGALFLRLSAAEKALPFYTHLGYKAIGLDELELAKLLV